MQVIRHYIQLLIETNHAGWTELDEMITALKSVSKFDSYNNKKDEDQLIDEYIQIVEQRGYDLLSFGHSRNVFSKPNLPWVIKITRDADSDWNYTNKIEYNKYFNDQIDNTLLPKIYSFDSNTSLWIIQEKVQTIDNISQLFMLFPYLNTQLQQINQMTQLSIAFKNDNDLWALIADLLRLANQINLNSLSHDFKPIQDYEYYFKITDDFKIKQNLLHIYSMHLHRCNQDYNIIEIKSLLSSVHLDITRDILYVSEHLYTVALNDLLINNVGYSLVALNSNKNQAFKAIRFFDYAE
jgi:hypothetical protein